jgi:hypothetical protein
MKSEIKLRESRKGLAGNGPCETKDGNLNRGELKQRPEQGNAP